MANISILPPQLANQIAAGEVVERPSSIIKELVENSLDAGATQIDIELDKGGSKRILIRDNGIGIIQEELALALSRHATSKIKTLDDLEQILSLGFRGEALASISSVSRLTLTSKTESQSEAWSAYAEGRDMAVQLKPASHPTGTSVEVLDLFFNTPARRKFLRSEKTEFNHIDELLKKIVLSRFDCGFTLKHNGQILRQYKIATTPSQIKKRLAMVCGSYFEKNSVYVEVEHQYLQIQGWVLTPQAVSKQRDIQYSYVNGRIIKDKLIYHAIAQAYEDYITHDTHPAYLLFISIDAKEVDVNVHPSKHEVRFHQSRLVHDFIYQSIKDLLSQEVLIEEPFIQPELPQGDLLKKALVLETSLQNNQKIDNRFEETQDRNTKSKESNFQYKHTAISKKTLAHEHHLYQPLEKEALFLREDLKEDDFLNPISYAKEPQYYGRVLIVIEDHYALVEKEQRLFALDLFEIQMQLNQNYFSQSRIKALPSQALLIPQRLSLSKDEWQTVKAYQFVLKRLGIELHQSEYASKAKNSITVLKINILFRQHNIQQFLPDLLYFLQKESDLFPVSGSGALDILDEAELSSEFWQRLAKWLGSQLEQKHQFSLADAISLLNEVEQKSLQLSETIFREIDLQLLLSSVYYSKKDLPT